MRKVILTSVIFILCTLILVSIIAHPVSAAKRKVISTHLEVKKDYPKQNHYVFVCNAKGFTPKSYSYYFGDGEKLVKIKNREVYHIYKKEGTYTARCISHKPFFNLWSFKRTYQVTSLQEDNQTSPPQNNTNSTPTTPPIDSGEPLNVTLRVDPLTVDLNYIFHCNASFNATNYTFVFGDGDRQIKDSNLYYPYSWNVDGFTGAKAFHHYNEDNKNFTVTCIASDGNKEANTSISISTPIATRDPSLLYSSFLTEQFLGNRTYNFTYHPFGFRPSYMGEWRLYDPNNASSTMHFSPTHTQSILVTFPYEANWTLFVVPATFEHGYLPTHYDSCEINNGNQCEYQQSVCDRSKLGCLGQSNSKIVEVLN